MAERLTAQNVIVAERGGEPSVQARTCATIDGSALDECAALVVNGPCGSRNELNCGATSAMPMGYIKVENVAAGQTVVQIVGSLPGHETHRLVCPRRNECTEARTESILKQPIDAAPPPVVVGFEHICLQEGGKY